MSRSKRKTDGESEKAPSPEPVAPEPALHGPDTVTLRLRERYFVDGVIREAGFTKDFSPAVAHRKLTRTQLWDRA